MSLNLAEIVKLLNSLDSLTREAKDVWKKIEAAIEKENDEKKRKKLLDACKRRDAAALRDLLWN